MSTTAARTGSLTFRQAAVTLVVVLLFGLLGGLIELATEWRSIRQQVPEQTHSTLELVRGPATTAAYQLNETLGAEVADGLFADRRFHAITLRDNFGTTIAERERAQAPEPGPLVHYLFSDIIEYRIDLVRAGVVPERDQQVGELIVRLDETEIAAGFLDRGIVVVLVGLARALGIAVLVVTIFYFMITRPLLKLHGAIGRIDPANPGQWQAPRLRLHDNDELGQVTHRLQGLMGAFQRVLEQRDQVQHENARMGAELDVSRRIQHIVLPSNDELAAIQGLQIAAFMEPADEVGGDYYDILRHADGVRIAIGDVTGHGLESGVVMLMIQSAVRTLVAHGEQDMKRVMSVLNETIYNNVERMGSGKNLTLALADYRPIRDAGESDARGHLRITGQHESVIVVRADGGMERIDTDALGFPIGLVEDVAEFMAETELTLQAEDVVVLYTDGITEAADPRHRLYGEARLMDCIHTHRRGSADAIKQAVVDDVRGHIDTQTLYDDLTLVVLKQG